MQKSKVSFLWKPSRWVKEIVMHTISNRGTWGGQSQWVIGTKDQFFSRGELILSLICCIWILPCLSIKGSKDWWGYCRQCSCDFHNIHLCCPASFVQVHLNCQVIKQTIQRWQAPLCTSQIKSLYWDNWLWKAMLPVTKGWESVKAKKDNVQDFAGWVPSIDIVY